VTLYISPKYLPQILDWDVEVMVVVVLRLNPFFTYLCFFSSTLFLLLVATRTPWCYSLTFLPLSLFFLFPYLPSMQLVFLYNRFTIIAKSARALWVCCIGTSREGSRIKSLWVCSFLGNNAHKVHVHHMKFDNNWEGSSFLPLVCVFLFLPIYFATTITFMLL
jgi:hypothetical protein